MYTQFRRLSHATAIAMGAPWAFGLALLIVLAWVVTGPIFDFSNTWQLVINTGTTIITFLMIFLVQNTQNRDSQVINLKLDELIRAVSQARNELVDMEHLSDEELRKLQHQFESLRTRAEATAASRRKNQDA
jgi:low affinity Fe/Cu permease